MEPLALNNAIKPLSWLLGTWESKNGHGSYPTINSFDYHEKLTFTSCGQPMLNYAAESWHPTAKRPLHLENGFLRIKPESNNISFILSHNFGAVTIEEGVYDNESKSITLSSINVGRMTFAKAPKVCKTERRYKLNEDGVLEFTFLMETENTELTKHLTATYVKTC